MHVFEGYFQIYLNYLLLLLLLQVFLLHLLFLLLLFHHLPPHHHLLLHHHHLLHHHLPLPPPPPLFLPLHFLLIHHYLHFLLNHQDVFLNYFLQINLNNIPSSELVFFSGSLSIQYNHSIYLFLFLQMIFQNVRMIHQIQNHFVRYQFLHSLLPSYYIHYLNYQMRLLYLNLNLDRLVFYIKKYTTHFNFRIKQACLFIFYLQR